MHDVVIRQAALIDLEGIARYTTEHWGTEQAEKYLTALRSDIQSLASFPRRHPAYASKNGNVHKMPSGHHFVLYRLTAGRAEIARVLHARMDVQDDLI